MSDPLRVDLDELDQTGESLLEAQRLAAERVEMGKRELVRLRGIEAFTKRVASRIAGSLNDNELEELRRLLWTHGDDDAG